MQRVSVVGNSGSGKTTLARQLAARLGVPHLELDAVFHQPGWRPLPDAEFRARVAAVADGGAWVIDGNYSGVRDLVWARADTVVWLDLPRPVVMRQVVRRTVRRVVRGEVLWNGNRELWRDQLSLDPERSVVRWAWSRHAEYRNRYRGAMADPACRHLRFVRLASRRQVRAFLAGSGRQADGVVAPRPAG